MTACITATGRKWIPLQCRVTLLDQMALTRQVTSLGLGARSTVNLKVRQPLAKALVHVRDGQETLVGGLHRYRCR